MHLKRIWERGCKWPGCDHPGRHQLWNRFGGMVALSSNESLINGALIYLHLHVGEFLGLGPQLHFDSP